MGLWQVRSTSDGSGTAESDAGEEFVRVESPGWACPSWHDLDRDGKKDLVVGQFHDGKMRVYRNLGEGKLAAGEWLQAEGDVAEVPGVW